MTLAPWLIPPDFIGAMKAGASLGLTSRGQDSDASQAAAKLGLGYAELASRQALAGANLAAQERQSQAADAIRQLQASAMEQYRRQQQALEASRIAETASAANALKDYHNRMATVAETKLTSGADAPFDPSSVADITVMGPDGKPIAVKTALGPNRWQGIQLKNTTPTADLTPAARLNAQLKIASEAGKIGTLDPTSPFYSPATNALQQAIEQLKAKKGTVNPVDDEDDPLGILK